jgi:hypothetical protein
MFDAIALSPVFSFDDSTQLPLPFLQKMGCASEDYAALYEQAMIEMQQPDFRVTWPLVTAWGSKPDTPAV